MKSPAAPSRGSINGTISPAMPGVIMSAVDSTFVVYNAKVDSNGFFKFSDLPPGTYNVSPPSIPGYASGVIVKMTVTSGKDVSTGNILLYANTGPNSFNYLSYDVNGTNNSLNTYYGLTYDSKNLNLYTYTNGIQQDAFGETTWVVMYRMDIILDNVTGIGTYSWSGAGPSAIRISSRQASISVAWPLNTWSTVNDGGSGTVQITAIDPIDRTITGTFTATTVPESSGSSGNKVITNGVFSNFRY